MLYNNIECKIEMVESEKGNHQPAIKRRGTAKDFPARPPSDMGPTQGGDVRRSFGGYGERNIPNVTQSAFDEKGDLTTVIQANSYRGLAGHTPIEEQSRRSAQGTRTPEQDQLAEDQRWAISRDTARRNARRRKK